MQCQELTETNHISQSNQSIQEEWNHYLETHPSSPRTYPERLALTNYFYEHQLQDRYLFHMTITYTPYQDQIYLEQDVNKFFINFYVKELLPCLLKTSNIHTNAKKQVQPICYAFLDEHEMKPVVRSTRTSFKNEPISVIEFPIRLHHHAILAMHHDNVNELRYLLGTNTLTRFGHKIMTSDLKECESTRVLYASKMYWKYPNYLMFPDKFHRVRHKYMIKPIQKTSQSNHQVTISETNENRI